MSNKVTTIILSVAGAVLTVAQVSLLGQYTTGTVQGAIYDATGAVVPNSAVVLRSLETNATRTFKTGPDGIYLFSAVPPGQYEVTAEAPGFSKAAAQFTAVASQTVTQDMKLNVSSTPTTVQVSVEASSAESDKTDPQLGTTRAAGEVNDLPTQHSTTGLVAFVPGVQPMYSPRGGSLVKLSGAQTGLISANGARAEYGNSELDFTDANDWEFGGFALGTVPVTDFIEEFKVLTSNVSAEYGIKSGGEIMMITKSGSNSWHGGANDYIQNDFFNARDFYDTTGKATRTDINNYGFSTGGALIKDRTFLFGGWFQNRTIGAGSTYLASVPTAAAVATVTDPGILSIIHTYLPMPAISTSNPLIGTFPVSYSSPGKGYQFLVRGDHRITNKNTVSARYFHSTDNTVLPFVGSLVGLANEGSLLTAESRNANVTDTMLISPTVVNQLRLGYARSVGFLPPQMPNPGPYFTITGLLTFGEYGGFPQGRIFNVYQVNDVITEAKGKHQLKEGFDVRDIQDNSYNAGNGEFFTRGYFVFPSEGAFLSAQASGYFQLFGPSAEPFRTKLYSFFAQDDYHVFPNLTVNAGLRWEYQGALTAAGGDFSLLDPQVPGSIGMAGPGPLGSFVVGNPLVHSNPLNLAPRMGFAWNPGAGKLVVRGGYGIFYNAFNFTPLADQGRTSPPVAYGASLTSFTGGNSISALLAGTSPFQQQWQAQAASGGFGTLTTFGSITTTNAHLRNSYLEQYNLTIEYQLPGSTLVSAAYVGSGGRHLAAFLPINSFVPAKLPAPATSLADQTARLADFQAAFAQESSGALRLDPRFSQVNLITDAATSEFNSLQLVARRTFQHGLTFQGAYTWSKSTDDASTAYPTQDYLGDGIPQNVNNLRQSRALSNFDIPHRFLLTGLYEVPLFRGRTGQASRLLSRGWQLGFTLVRQSGVPVNIFSGPVDGIADVNLDGNMTGGAASDNTLANCSAGGTGISLPGAFSSPYTYSQPFLGNNGTCGRNIARQPGLLNVNSELMKSFTLAEKGPMGSGPWNLQLGWEMYNALNNPSFYVASVNNLYVSNPTTFGLMAALPQRTMEMAIRLLW